jgi:hypothetical protein
MTRIQALVGWWLLAGSVLAGGMAPAATSVATLASTPQTAEAGTSTRRLDRAANAQPLSRVCEPDARWLRLEFSDLTLGDGDTLVLTSDDGDRYVFHGQQWQHRSFHSRALRGSCVNLQPHFMRADSRYEIASYQFGTTALEDTHVVVAGAGDLCDSTPVDCQHTSDLIIAINPDSIFTAGDNAYESGTLSQYLTRYDPNWGRFKLLTHPAPGNHEYATAGASGYFDYFNGVGVNSGPAGERGKGYYSYDVGDWHFIALNTMAGGTVTNAQLAWLTKDLGANSKPCTAAYFHHPLLSRGVYTGSPGVKPIFERLYEAKADLVLVGHDHNYQRYAPMTPDLVGAVDGLRQIIVGTGGGNRYTLNGTHPLLEASRSDTWGVLRLDLTATGYSGEFVPIAGRTWTDHFSGTCHKAAVSNIAPVAGFNYTVNGLSATFTDTSSDSDGSVVTREWDFGDGSQASAGNPTHTYASAGTYDVTLTIIDDAGASDSVTRAVTVTAQAANTPPVASFSYSVRGLTATFKNLSSDSDGSIVASQWDFGDGISSPTTSPTHTYAGVALYNVQLTVTDDDGAQHSLTRRVPTLDLKGTVARPNGTVDVTLEWIGAQTSSVDVFRNNVRVVVTANDGAYTDATGLSGSGTLTYRVCEASRAVCTQTITLAY